MTNKNRKLVVRKGKEKLAKAFNVKVIEQMIAEVPDDAWLSYANKSTFIAGIFLWSRTSQGDAFWDAVNDIFTLAPLKKTAKQNSKHCKPKKLR